MCTFHLFTRVNQSIGLGTIDSDIHSPQPRTCTLCLSSYRDYKAHLNLNLSVQFNSRSLLEYTSTNKHVYIANHMQEQSTHWVRNCCNVSSTSPWVHERQTGTAHFSALISHLHLCILLFSCKMSRAVILKSKWPQHVTFNLSFGLDQSVHLVAFLLSHVLSLPPPPALLQLLQLLLHSSSSSSPSCTPPAVTCRWQWSIKCEKERSMFGHF